MSRWIAKGWEHAACGSGVVVRTREAYGRRFIEHRCVSACVRGGEQWQDGEPGDGKNYVCR